MIRHCRFFSVISQIVFDTGFKQNIFREKNPSSETLLNREHMSLLEYIFVFIIAWIRLIMPCIQRQKYYLSRWNFSASVWNSLHKKKKKVKSKFQGFLKNMAVSKPHG